MYFSITSILGSPPFNSLPLFLKDRVTFKRFPSFKNLIACFNLVSKSPEPITGEITTSLVTTTV